MKLTPYSADMARAPIGSLSGLLVTGFLEREYHLRPEVSTHDAQKLSLAPAKYHHAKTHPEEPTDAMRLGSALHLAVLERDRWESSVSIPPEDAPRKPSSAQREAKKPSEDTLAAIEWWDWFNAESVGKLSLKRAEASEIWERRAAIVADHYASELLSLELASEVSIFWRDPETNTPRRGRIDRLRAGNIVVDLKSTSCSSAPSFARDAVTFGYYRQAADYLDALELLTEEPWTFWWIASESEAPWITSCYQCPPEGIDLGRIGRKQALEAWDAGQKTGTWPGYQTQPSQLIPPVWAMKEANL